MRSLVDWAHPEISVRRQCELLGVNRSGLYYEPVGESDENLLLMRLLDEQYTRVPFYGSRKMTEWLATHRWPTPPAFERLLPFAFQRHSMEGRTGVKGSLRRAKTARP
jgi:hypothetical protein